MSRLRLLGLPALLAGAILVAPTGGAGAAVTVGISDQQAQTFADARLRSLGLRHARLVVPWDAATSEPERVQGWLDAVRAAGMAPHVAFEHLRSDRCPGPAVGQRDQRSLPAARPLPGRVDHDGVDDDGVDRRRSHPQHAAGARTGSGPRRGRRLTDAPGLGAPGDRRPRVRRLPGGAQLSSDDRSSPSMRRAREPRHDSDTLPQPPAASRPALILLLARLRPGLAQLLRPPTTTPDMRGQS